MTATTHTWTTIRFLRTVQLPRFRVFAGHTYATYKPVDAEVEIGGGRLVEDVDFDVLYQGQDRGAALRADTVYRTEESAKYYGVRS